MALSSRGPSCSRSATDASVRRGVAIVRCALPQPMAEQPQPPISASSSGTVSFVGRRNLLLAGSMALIPLLQQASQPKAALAFGSGFPGYDMNVEGRKRANARNQRELDEQKAKAAAYKAAAKAKAEAAAAEAAKS